MCASGPPASSNINVIFLMLIIVTSLTFLFVAAWVGGILLALTLTGAYLTLILFTAHYVAPEDATGIVYWHYKGRLYWARSIPPRRSTFIIPVLQIVKEIHTRTRVIDIVVEDVLTADRGPIRCHISVMFQVHAYQTVPEFRKELARFGDEQWAMVVRKIGRAALRDAISTLSFDDIIGSNGADMLSQEVQTRLSQYVAPRGIKITGVSVQDRRPAQNIESIIHQHFVARMAGEAMRDRIAPPLETLTSRDGDLRNVLLALLLAGQDLGVNIPNLFISLGNGQSHDTLGQLIQWIIRNKKEANF